jgi:alpha-galactosidase
MLMDFGLEEVRAYWIDRVIRMYHEWNVRWLRWDFNQNPRAAWDHDVVAGQIGWRQIAHTTGLYRTWDEIRAACPDLVIDQCASGGYRIDLGTVRRGHTFWMNDHTTNSDIVRAMQHGLNTILPGNYANTNLCQFRHDYSDYDFLSHGAGGYGYSGRIWEAPKADFQRYAASVDRFKDYRHLLLADYYRPTGQPTRADQYAAVTFSNGSEAVTMRLNHDGPRTAVLEYG